MPVGRIAPDDDIALLEYWRTYRGPIYAGLTFSDPFIVNDPLSVEVLGSAYRRIKLTLAIVDKVLRNTADLHWAVGRQTRVSGIAGWDDSFNGKPRFYTPLPEPVDYPVGGTHSHPALALFIGLDS